MTQPTSAVHRVQIARTKIEDVFRRDVHAREIARARVQDALRFPRGARRVEDEERMLGVEGFPGDLARAIAASLGFGATKSSHHASRPSFISDGRLRVADAPKDDDLFDARRLLEGDVGHLLQRHRRCAATPRAVLREEDLGAEIVDAIAERVAAAESAEDDGGEGAPKSRAREHRDDGLGDHSHVDGDAIARLDAVIRSQRRRHAHDLAMQFEVRDRPDVAWLAFEDDGRLVAP